MKSESFSMAGSKKTNSLGQFRKNTTSLDPQNSHEESPLPVSSLSKNDETKNSSFKKPTRSSAGDPKKSIPAPSRPFCLQPFFFWKTQPSLKAETTLPPSFSSRLFDLLARRPLFPLVLMLLLQTVFSLNARELWYADEIRHADAFQNFLHNPGFALTMDGELYPDKPPLYFAFLWVIHAAINFFSNSTGVSLFFAGAAISALFLLMTTMLLGRLVPRMDNRSLLAGGIVLLTSWMMLALVHHTRMDLLFSTFIVLSQISFFLALKQQRSFFLMSCGFVLAGLACLIKGPYGAALPLLTATVFACWKKTPGRIFSPDVLVGFILLLAVLLAWIIGVYLQTGNFDFLINVVLKTQIVERTFDAKQHNQPWYYYLISLPLFLLPWTLLLFSMPWQRLFSKETRCSIAHSRQPEGDGLAFLWITVLGTLLLLSSVSTKIHVYYLPAVPALALLTGRAVLQLTNAKANLVRHSFAIFFLLLGITFTLFGLLLFGLIPVPDIATVPKWHLSMNKNFFFVSIMFVLLAGSLWFGLRTNRPEGILLLVGFFTTALAYPLANMVAPSFNAVLSPKAQALVIQNFVNEGYKPFVFNIYGGTYSYYLGQPTPKLTNLQQAEDMVKANTPFILALREKELAKWLDKPQQLHEVNRQWIESKEYILLAFPVEANGSPVDLTKLKEVERKDQIPAQAPTKATGAPGPIDNEPASL